MGLSCLPADTGSWGVCLLSGYHTSLQLQFCSPIILSRAGGEGRGQAACHHNSPCFCRKICSVEEPCWISPTSEIVFSFQLMMTYIISRSLEHQRFFLRQRRKAKHNSPAVRASKDKAKCCFPGVPFSSRASSSHPKSVGAAGIPLGRPPDPARNNRLVKDHLHGGGRGESWEHQPSSHGQQMRHVQPLCTWLRAHAVALLLEIQPAVQGKLIEQAAKGGKERAGRFGGDRLP